MLFGIKNLRGVIPRSNSVCRIQQCRLKRSKAGLSPEAQKVVSQLSVLSAGRKMPRLIKLCNEDYVKHKTIMKAWSLERKNKIEQQKITLKKQYESMKKASEDLKFASPKLFTIANEHEYGKRFPLEIRIPTDYPPRQLWYYNYVPRQKK